MIFGNCHFKFGKMKEEKKKEKSISVGSLIVNQTFS